MLRASHERSCSRNHERFYTKCTFHITTNHGLAIPAPSYRRPTSPLRLSLKSRTTAASMAVKRTVLSAMLFSFTAYPERTPGVGQAQCRQFSASVVELWMITVSGLISRHGESWRDPWSCALNTHRVPKIMERIMRWAYHAHLPDPLSFLVVWEH